MLKKIFVFISSFSLILFFPVSSAFASGSFTASNVTYNAGTTTLDFDYVSAVDYCSVGITQITFWDDTQSSQVGYSSDGGSCTGNTTGHVTVIVNNHNFITLINGDTVHIQITPNVGASDDSQTFTWPMAGGGGGAVLGAVTLDPTVQGNLNSGIGSLGTLIIGEVINLLPYILGVVAVLFVVRFGLGFFRRHSR